MEHSSSLPPRDGRTIVVIGSSTGGARTLEVIFSQFPLVDAAVILVQHMPYSMNNALCRHIEEISFMETGIAEDGEAIEHGKVYVAPSDLHLKLVENRTISLFDDAKVQYVRPSIDVAMMSLTRRGSDRFAGGVILSGGMGSDGAKGSATSSPSGGDHPRAGPPDMRHPLHAPCRVRDRAGGPDALAGRDPRESHPVCRDPLTLSLFCSLPEPGRRTRTTALNA